MGRGKGKVGGRLERVVSLAEGCFKLNDVWCGEWAIQAVWKLRTLAIRLTFTFSAASQSLVTRARTSSGCWGR